MCPNATKQQNSAKTNLESDQNLFSAEAQTHENLMAFWVNQGKVLEVAIIDNRYHVMGWAHPNQNLRNNKCFLARRARKQSCLQEHI